MLRMLIGTFCPFLQLHYLNLFTTKVYDDDEADEGSDGLSQPITRKVTTDQAELLAKKQSYHTMMVQREMRADPFSRCVIAPVHACRKHHISPLNICCCHLFVS